MFIRRDALFVYRTVNVFPYPKLIIVWTARYITLSLTRPPVDLKKPVDLSFTKPIDKMHHTKQVAIKTVNSQSCGQFDFCQKPFLSDSLFQMLCKIKVMMKLINIYVNPAKVGQMADLYGPNFGMGSLVCLKFAVFIFLP